MKDLAQLTQKANRIRKLYFAISDNYSVGIHAESLLNRRYTNAMLEVSKRITTLKINREMLASMKFYAYLCIINLKQ